MLRQATSYIAVLSFVLIASGVANAAPPDDGTKWTRDFWSALASGNLKAMKTFYAPQVTLKAGSELLKSRWALSPKVDRKKGLIVERDKLLAGYERLIDSAGRKRWRSVFDKIDSKRITTVAATDRDKPFTGVRPGDTLLNVATGPGDDKLMFVLRQDDRKRWQVVAEATDY
jgi:hypothetical protein